MASAHHDQPRTRKLCSDRFHDSPSPAPSSWRILAHLGSAVGLEPLFLHLQWGTPELQPARMSATPSGDESGSRDRLSRQPVDRAVPNLAIAVANAYRRTADAILGPCVCHS